MWCLRKEYDTLVKKTWCTQFVGSHMFRLVKKRKLLKKKSKEWSKSQFGDIFRQLRKADNQLQEIQNNLLVNPSNSSYRNKQEIFLIKRSSLLTFSNEYWKQKSKIDYLHLEILTLRILVHMCLLDVIEIKLKKLNLQVMK